MHTETPAPRRQPLTLPRPDTRAWRIQVWTSFALALGLSAVGLAWLPGDDLDRAFMVMGYLFTLSSAFVLAKHVRDEQVAREAGARGASGIAAAATPGWGVVVWAAFGLAMALTAWGLVRMDINPTWKAYLGVAWLFLVSSTFTLAKTLRDAHEAAVAAAVARALAERGDA